MPQVGSIAAQAPPTPYIKMGVTAKSSFPRSTGTLGPSTWYCLGGYGGSCSIIPADHPNDADGLRWCTGVQLCPAAPGQGTGTARGDAGAAQDPVSPFRRSSKMVR